MQFATVKNISVNPIAAFEKIVSLAQDNQTTHHDNESLNNYLRQCLCALAGDHSDKCDLVQALSRDDAVRSKLLCACLLRLLLIEQFKWLQQGAFRPKVCHIFDVNLTEVYKQNSI